MSDNGVSPNLSRRGLFGLGVGATTAAVLAGCAGGRSAEDTAGGAQPEQSFSGRYDGPAVTLAYWNGFTGGDGPFMRQLVADFMRENPKITIDANTVEWSQYYQRMPAAVTANQGPDVGVMHVDQLATNAVRRIIVPVDDLASALGMAEDDFSAPVWQAGIYQDKRYGIPLDVHSLGMYYNSDQVERAKIAQPPADAAAFAAALDALKGAGFANPFWMPSRWPAHLMFLSLLWQNGGEPYAADGSRATFDSEEGIAALRWMVDVIAKGYSPGNVAQDSQYVGFKNQKVPITWDGIWQINDLKAAKVPFGLAPVPKIGEQDAVWANSHNFYITKQAGEDDNKLQAAKVFIDWISRKSGEWAGAGWGRPRASVRESAAVTQSTQAPIAAKIDNMRFLPPVPGLGDVQFQTLEIAVAEATLGKTPPDRALKDQAARATKLMQDNQKKFGS